ncbi:MAG TPA: sulfide/dihydroorotate dehydrogenase-like FAD/NAD-binding protein [Spirochaetota bacterium]|nr:sulfide/dihydroorotate dehydrogenase-like FAD/NAD-binding protein [Spirochaetota bacterium]HPF04495.1 sulfide/dihydroorotate dehydrogenase-like FAD/NAD-binding protein [Spirochaetota bacterium]HPJ42172.1 sulfide/dihydroorotate dehydrogenase-like FAD/NAD-binding protein [Spirochaetota bacterium]HPR38117.1 sulfide/dihydroorotate dehydrogenase-like FAD/NAD-binding protein [Spirochaetota bacterium]HRX46020.1 sulfide/dihydroorotate dehydrogenase-like FAD/NAD-binding protein [Spirochaetota bacteri
MHYIHSNDIIQPTVGRMVVDAPYVAEHRKAGQFIILLVDEFGERLPLTIADADKEKGTITLIYQIVGTTTAKLAKLKAGDSLYGIAGPLGHPTEIKKYGTVACVGGGIGIAPLHPISKAMKEAGNRVINILGARSENLFILEKEMSAIADECDICTDDGSKGEKGFVTDVLKGIMAKEKIDLVVAIGPIPMMKAVSDLTRNDGIKTFVSLNSVMIDGTGMCGGCRVTVGGETKFTCVDGPEFDGHLVDFESLGKRLKTYQKEETESYEEYKHKCRLDGVEIR